MISPFRLLYTICFTFPITSSEIELSCLRLATTTIGNINKTLCDGCMTNWLEGSSRNQALSLLYPEIIVWHAQEHATTTILRNFSNSFRPIGFVCHFNGSQCQRQLVAASYALPFRYVKINKLNQKHIVDEEREMRKIKFIRTRSCFSFSITLFWLLGAMRNRNTHVHTHTHISFNVWHVSCDDEH